MKATSLAVLACLAVACGPKVQVEAIRTTVEPARDTTRTDGPESLLPDNLPSGWTLAGGPATFNEGELASYLTDKYSRIVHTETGAEPRDPAPWAQRFEILVTAEYLDRSEAAVAVQVFKARRPQDAKQFETEFLRPAKTRRHAVIGPYLATVEWFDPEDADIADAGHAIADSVRARLEARHKSNDPAGAAVNDAPQ
jgi:hypothetical protein